MSDNAPATAPAQQLADDPPAYTGRIWLGKEPDTIEGFTTDRLGIVTRYIGHRDRQGGGYQIQSVAVEIPEHLRIPLIDDPS